MPDGRPASWALAEDLAVGVVLLDAGGRIERLNGVAEGQLRVSDASARGQLVSDYLREPSVTDLVQRAARGQRVTAHAATTRAGEASFTLAAAPSALWGGVLLTLTPAAPEPSPGGPFAHSLRALARTLAHEVKNPLAGLIGASQLLLRQARADQTELLTLIRDEGRRIGRIADRFASLETYSRPDLQLTNVHTAVERALQLHTASAPETLPGRDFDPSLPDVRIDPDHVASALINLLKNAAHAVREDGSGGRICLQTRYRPGIRLDLRTRRSGAVEVAVEDNGRGVDEAMRANLFRPFATDKPEGTGVGLALVAEIMQAHGGRVEWQSVPGFTRFALLFPLPEGDAP